MQEIKTALSDSIYQMPLNQCSVCHSTGISFTLVKVSLPETLQFPLLKLNIFLVGETPYMRNFTIYFPSIAAGQKTVLNPDF